MIERSADGQQWDPLATLNPGADEYMDSNLTEATTWYYRIREQGSDIVTASVAATTWLGTPTNVTAVAVSPSEIDLSWDDNSSHEDGFTIEMYYNGHWGVLHNVDADTTQYAVTIGLFSQPLQPGTTYSFRVYVFGNGYGSRESASASATTPAT